MNLAVRAVEYGPLNWPITARILTKRYNNTMYITQCSGLLVSELDSWLSSLSSIPERGNYVLFKIGKSTTLAVLLCTQVYKWVLANLILWWTSVPCRGSRNIPSHFMLQKPRSMYCKLHPDRDQIMGIDKNLLQLSNTENFCTCWHNYQHSSLCRNIVIIRNNLFWCIGLSLQR